MGYVGKIYRKLDFDSCERTPLVRLRLLGAVCPYPYPERGDRMFGRLNLARFAWHCVEHNSVLGVGLIEGVMQQGGVEFDATLDAYLVRAKRTWERTISLTQALWLPC